LNNKGGVKIKKIIIGLFILLFAFTLASCAEGPQGIQGIQGEQGENQVQNNGMMVTIYLKNL
jgi:starvation-inducible outer membrane lipoprotein